MTGKRLRLDDDERVYLMDLVKENVRLQGSLVSLSIRKLLKKLGDDSPKPYATRNIASKPHTCQDCGKVVKNGAGLYRHTISTHHRPPTADEKELATNDAAQLQALAPTKGEDHA